MAFKALTGNDHPERPEITANAQPTLVEAQACNGREAGTVAPIAARDVA
jgi:hypothetical protein